MCSFPCLFICIVSLPFRPSHSDIEQQLQAGASPPHAIDSIPLVVSLPLLYLWPFCDGISKGHGISIVWTSRAGKTLAVRVFMKEAKSTVLVVSLSDVIVTVSFYWFYPQLQA